MSDENATCSNRQRALEEQVILVSPTMGCWEGRYQLPKRKTDITLDGVPVRAGLTTPRTIMLTDQWPRDAAGVSWKKRFQQLQTRKNGVLDKYSVPFPIRGVRIIPKTAALAFFEELFGETVGELVAQQEQHLAAGGQQSDDRYTRRESRIHEARQQPDYRGKLTPVVDFSRDQPSIAYSFHETVAEFLGDLDEVLQQIQTNMDSEVWAAVEARVPKTVARMRSKFHLDIVPVALAGGQGVEVDAGTLRAHQTLVLAAVQRKVDEAIESMIAGPREQLGDALASLRELINRDGRVTTRSFQPVRDAIAKIRLFDCVADDVLLQEMATLEQRLNITAAPSLDSRTAASSGFTAALDSVAEGVRDAQQQAGMLERFGKRARGLTLG